MSKVCWAPRCTPPSPPVTKTRMPAIAASRIVEATVVAPWVPRATTYGRSRTLTLATSGCDAEQLEVVGGRGRSAGRPSSTAMVAGTAPCARTIPSTSVAISTLSRVGHAVADDRALQRDHGGAGRERVGDLVGQRRRDGWAAVTAGSSRARRSGPAGPCGGWPPSGRPPPDRTPPPRPASAPPSSAWQNAASIASPAPVTSTTSVAGTGGDSTTPSGPLSDEPPRRAAPRPARRPRSCERPSAPPERGRARRRSA